MDNNQYSLLLGVFDWLGTVPYTNLSQSEISTLQQKRNDLRTVLEEGHPDISTAMALRGIQDIAPAVQTKKPLNLYCIWQNDFVAAHTTEEAFTIFIGHCDDDSCNEDDVHLASAEDYTLFANGKTLRERFEEAKEPKFIWSF